MEQSRPAGFIVFFVFSLWGGGAERVVSRLASEWVKDGTRVAIITETLPETDQYPIDPRIERYSTGTSEAGGNILVKTFNFLKKTWILRRILKRIGATTVLSFMCRCNNIAWLATRCTRMRVVVSERNDPTHSEVTKLDALIRPLTYARADAVVAQTHTVAALMQSMFRPRCLSVIPNPVPAVDGRSRPEPPAARPYILGVGRLTRQKGFDLLIRAYAASEARRDYDLMIVGQGAELETLRSLAQSLDIGSGVIFRGHVPDATPFFNECSLFVLSSLYEGFPNVLVEAMSAGRPVITFDFPSGAGEIVKDGEDGMIVPLGDIEGLSRAIDRIASDEALRARLGGNARNAANLFSMACVLEQWKKIAELPNEGTENESCYSQSAPA